jgi:hypothetical protein
MPETKTGKGHKFSNWLWGTAISLAVAGLLAYGLTYAIMTEWYIPILRALLPSLPASLLLLAGVGYRKLAVRLIRTLLYGFLLGGGIGVLAGGLLFLVVVFLDASGLFNLGEGVIAFLIFGMILACAVVGVATGIAIYKQIWRRRQEFRREAVSPLLLLAAAGVLAGGLWLLNFLTH